MQAEKHRHEYLLFPRVWCDYLKAVLFALGCSVFWYASPLPAQPQSEAEGHYELLAEALADDNVRDQLVEHLRQLAVDDGVEDFSPVADEAAIITGEEEDFIAAELVVELQSFAQGLRADLVNAWDVILGLIKGDPRQIETIKSWQMGLLSLLLTIVVTLLGFGILRRVAHPVFNLLSQWAVKLPSAKKLARQQRELERRHFEQWRRLRALREPDEDQNENEAPHEFAHVHTDTAEGEQHFQAARSVDPDQAKKNYIRRYAKLRKMVAVAGAFAVDVIAILAAALVGYTVTVAAFAHRHDLTLFSMQFLTAFVAVEIIKAIVRVLFAAHYQSLRLIPIQEQGAKYSQRWLTNVISVGGYGLLVLVPVLQTLLTPSVANVIGSILVLMVYIYAIRVLWGQRHSVTHDLLQAADQSTDAVAASMWRVLARIWLIVTWLYFTILLITTLVDQQNALTYMAQGSLQTLLTLMFGGALFLLINSLASHHIHLAPRWNEYFPLLEDRLNSYVPTFFSIVRLFLLAAIVFSLLDAWRLFNFKVWVSHGQGMIILHTVLRIALVCVVAALSWLILASFIEHRLAISGAHMPSERERTLLMLFKNALVIIISTLTVLVVLSQLGIDIGPLIAGAGVVGLAVGFGAQKLVQDVITGVFIQLENGMNQNDVVEVAGLFGSVEKLTIRSVVIRTIDGGYHLVPFSSIDSVSNHTRDYGYTLGVYVIGHRESIDEAMHYLALAFDDLKQDETVSSHILEDITIQGVTEINQHGVTLRVLIKTTAGMQWAVHRSYNRLVKMRFDEAGIELPYPHTVLHFGRDKQGQASPVDIRMVETLANFKEQSGQSYPPAGQMARSLEGNS